MYAELVPMIGGSPEEGPEPERRCAKLGRKHIAMASALREGLTLEGPSSADLTLLASGGVCSSLRWMLNSVNAAGEKKVNLVAIRRLLPFPSQAIAQVLKSAKAVMVVESEADGPLRWLTRREAGIELNTLRLGLPMNARRAFESIREALNRG